jgi:phosphohistidine phosphatase
MDLLIVRHAIAFDRNPKRWPDDDERPLTPDGMLRARKAAAGLKRIAERPARVFTSPLVRAKQTAAILAEFAGWPRAVEYAELRPGEPPEAVLEALRRNSNKLVAVVGHQPHLGQLVAACLPGSAKPEALELKKGGVVCLSFNGPPRAGHALLRWAAPPRILRAVRS